MYWLVLSLVIGDFHLEIWLWRPSLILAPPSGGDPGSSLEQEPQEYPSISMSVQESISKTPLFLFTSTLLTCWLMSKIPRITINFVFESYQHMLTCPPPGSTALSLTSFTQLSDTSLPPTLRVVKTLSRYNLQTHR